MRLALRLPSHAPEAIARFLRHHVRAAGREGVVVGLSGGIDSALVARVARDALGAERVLGVLLPDAAFPGELLGETERYAEGLGIAHRTLGLGPAEAAVADLVPPGSDRLARGNSRARLRMVVLYALAREHHRLVVGTGNKSELLLGYFTKFGDGGCDLLPIGDLYKTQVRAWAETLELPTAVRERVPSAGLWEGQTDEGELGLSYERIDRVLFGLEQLGTPEEVAEASGEELSTVLGLVERMAANRHKRLGPPVAKVGLRTVGIDWSD